MVYKEMTKGNENVAPARGEDNALMGFTAQYLVAAELIVRNLQKSDFEKVILKDLRAEKVDDFQIVTKNRVDAYQVKWHDHAGSLTQGELKGSDTKKEDSYIHHLATGWKALRKVNNDKSVFVHLYTNNYASLSDIIGKYIPAPRHLAEFIRVYWEATIVSQDVYNKWLPFIAKIQNASGLNSDEFEKFRTHCKLDLERSLPQECGIIETRYYKDIIHLQGKLLQIAGKQQGTINLTRQDILDLAEWNERFQYKARHEFPYTTFRYSSCLIGFLTNSLRFFIVKLLTIKLL